MEVMQLSDLDLDKTYSYADYLKWTFEDRLELIKGKVFEMTPAPASKHQRVSWVISGELYHYLKDKSCEAYSAPFDVRLPRKQGDGDQQIFTVIQPDICVICDATKIDQRGCLGAPDIVVEILSPGNNLTELRHKYEVYEEAGVLEYWIIYPQHKSLIKYILTDTQYKAARPLAVGDTLTTAILPGFELKLEILFAGM